MTNDAAEREQAIRAMPEAGSVVVDAATARALRTRGTALTTAGVMRSAGAFGPGEAIYVVQRGVDGGQRVCAKGIAAIAAAELDASRQAPGAAGDPAIVIRGEDLALF